MFKPAQHLSFPPASNAPHARPLAAAIRTGLAGLALGLMVLGGCSQKADPQRLLADAQAALAKGDSATAVIHLKSLLQAQPDNPAGRAQMGQLALQAGDLVSAENDLKRALELNADPAVIAQPYLEALILQGATDKVLTAAAGLSKAAPGVQAIAQVYSGRAKLMAGKVDEAREHFANALKLDSGSLAAKVGNVATELVPGGDLAKAREQLAALQASNAKDPDVLALQAHFARLDAKPQDARQFLAQAAAAKPYDQALQSSLIQTSIELADYDTAQKQIASARKIAPNSIALSYLDALVAFRQGRIGDARERVMATVAAAPGYLPAAELAGEVALLTQEYALAERYGKQLIEANPKAMPGYRMLGKAYLALGSPERALGVIQPLLEAGTKDTVILALAGDAAMKTGDTKRGIQWLDQARAQAGNNVALKLASANARISTGSSAQGLQVLDTALAPSDIAAAGLSIAASYAAAGSFDKATDVIMKYIESRPKDPAGPHALGVIASQRGQADKAQEYWGKAIALDAGFIPAVTSLAQADLNRGQVPAAKGRFLKVLEAQPRNVAAMLALARLNATTGGPEAETMKYFEQAREAAGKSVVPVVAQAQYLMQANQTEKAIALLEPLLQGQTPDPSVNNILVAAYMDRSEPAKALALVEKQLLANPTSGALHIQIGNIRLALNDAAGALASFRKAAELQPNTPEPKTAMVGGLYRAGQKAEALKLAQDIQRDHPESPAGHLMESDIALAEQRLPDALNSARKAYSVASIPPSLLKLHRLLYLTGNDAEARSLVRKWWGAGSKDSTTLFLASQTMLERKDWKEAVGALNEVLKLTPNSAAALNNAAVAMQEMKEPKAIVLAERAYQIEPNNSSVLDTYGWLLVQAGDNDKGIKLLRSAVTLSPKRPDIRLHLAQALLKAGDKPGAANEAKTILSGNPPPEIRSAAQQIL